MRRRRWLDVIERALAAKTGTPTGVALRFRAEAGVAGELRELADLERDCCSFATWAVTSAEGSVVLEVSAEGEGIASVQAMFEDAQAAAGGRSVLEEGAA